MVARRAHNPKVVGSNPAPATIIYMMRRRRSSVGALNQGPATIINSGIEINDYYEVVNGL